MALTEPSRFMGICKMGEMNSKFMRIVIGISTVVLVSFVGSMVAGNLTSEDFEGLTYSDAAGDDYHFYCENQGFNLAMTYSRGTLGDYPRMDIIAINSSFDEVTGNATVTLIMGGEILKDPDVCYYVCIVERTIYPSGPLFHPRSIDDVTYRPLHDLRSYDEILLHLEYSDPYHKTLFGQRIPVIDNTIVFNIPSEKLESC